MSFPFRWDRTGSDAGVQRANRCNVPPSPLEWECQIPARPRCCLPDLQQYHINGINLEWKPESKKLAKNEHLRINWLQYDLSRHPAAVCWTEHQSRKVVVATIRDKLLATRNPIAQKSNIRKIDKSNENKLTLVTRQKLTSETDDDVSVVADQVTARQEFWRRRTWK